MTDGLGSLRLQVSILQEQLTNGWGRRIKPSCPIIIGVGFGNLAPANLQFFTWQMCHDSLLTRSLLANRGININNMCPLCGLMEEYFFHCFSSCDWDKDVWILCFHNSLQIPSINTSALLYREKDVWIFLDNNGMLAPCVMWKLWCRRNRCILYGDKDNHMTIALQSQVLFKDIIHAHGNGQNYSGCRLGIVSGKYHLLDAYD